ncbi:MAG: hypothetical protein ACRERV_13505 [Methylococcales bacterium]
MLSIGFEDLPTYRMGMIKGNEKGALEQALAIAAKLLAEGLEPARIDSITSLSTTEIEDLKSPDRRARNR